MGEEEARSRIITWAKDHFAEEESMPEVEVVSILYNENFQGWEAELTISTSADNPYVNFFEDSMYQHGVQVVSVEY